MSDKYDFNSVYKEFNVKILHFVSNMVDPDDAEDVTQETFLKISRSLDTFKGDSKLSTWIYRIASNTALDKIKSAANKYPHEELELETENEAALKDTWSGEQELHSEEKHVRVEMNQCIREFIEKLPVDYKTVMVLSEIEGLKNQEIADVLEISLDNVKARLHRARAKLKIKLNDGCDFYRDDRNELACDRKTPAPNTITPIEFKKKK